jgi:hypothetical protein
VLDSKLTKIKDLIIEKERIESELAVFSVREKSPYSQQSRYRWCRTHEDIMDRCNSDSYQKRSSLELSVPKTKQLRPDNQRRLYAKKWPHP